MLHNGLQVHKVYTNDILRQRAQGNFPFAYYSLCFKIKVTFGHKLRYEIKVTFGEISLKLCQTNWNVAKNNVNVVVDELPSQITIHNF